MVIGCIITETHFQQLVTLKCVAHSNPVETIYLKRLNFMLTCSFFAAVFVSRLSDSLPANFFAGLINVGDEIIEINGTPMKKLSLEETYDLMARQDELRLKILPFMARRDV